jgi:regulator of protease activity HflC (stomatin/prohibitin superfamily)
VRQAEAEAKKNVAMADGEAKVKIALAEGQAQANKALTASLSEPLIRWRELDITEKAVAKWNGARPMVEGKESGLLLSITPEQK